VAREVQVDVSSGVGEADVGLVGGEDEPVRAPVGRGVGETQFDDGAPGDRVEVDVAVDVPDEQTRVEILLAVFGGQPAPPPDPQLFDHRTQLFSRRGEQVAHPGLVLAALDDAGDREFIEAAREDAGRDVRYAAAQVVEARAAAQQLPHDQWRPAPREGLGSQRDRTELAVSVHPWSLPTLGAVAICYLNAFATSVKICSMNTSAEQAAPGPAEVWSTGDYAEVCDRMIPQLGARLVELAGVGASEEVLDVAAGTGNATLPAAAAGAVVTALDITPALLEVGARRARASGLEVAWVHGDAHALPFADASFDRVLSCVGVQFCGDQHAAAAELVRVCRPGGRIALTAWTPEGFIGQVLATIARATATTAPRPSPLLWGREDGVRELFGDHAQAAVFERAHVEMPAASAAAWVDFMALAYGPMARARAALENRGAWEPLREQLTEVAAAHDTSDSDAFAARAEYLNALLER
jgi:SAM-dependent methyltransferase